MALNTLPAGAFADDAITSDKINLANTFAFTGTVTGTPQDMVLLSSVDSHTSPTSAVVFNSSVVDSTTYRSFLITGSNIYSVTNAQGLRFYTSHDNGSSFNNDNKRGQVYRNLYSGSSFGHEQQTVSSSGYCNIGGSMSSSNNLGGSMTLWVHGSSKSYWKYILYQIATRHSGGEAYNWNGAFEQQNSNAYNYFKLTVDSGNIGGFFYLYGLKGSA